MAQIWGMINGLQLLVYLPVVNLNFPANMAKVCESIISVASFSIEFLDMYTLTKPILGDLLKPPFNEEIFTDYGDEHFISEL